MRLKGGPHRPADLVVGLADPTCQWPWPCFGAVSSGIFLAWDSVFFRKIASGWRNPCRFSCLIPKKHIITKTCGIMSVKTYFYHLYLFHPFIQFYWQLKVDIIYHQQTPPHLGFYSSSIKGCIKLEITLRQDIYTYLFLVIPVLWDSKCLPWYFGWLKMEQLETDHYHLSI